MRGEERKRGRGEEKEEEAGEVGRRWRSRIGEGGGRRGDIFSFFFNNIMKSDEKFLNLCSFFLCKHLV